MIRPRPQCCQRRYKSLGRELAEAIAGTAVIVAFVL
jgi:hypothetical protein